MQLPLDQSRSLTAVCLQCSLPVFEGLISEDGPEDAVVQDLLWNLNVWYAHAAMRLHTDETLASMKVARKALGASIRKFASQVCPKFATKLLPKEVAAQDRRCTAAAAKAIAKALETPSSKKNMHKDSPEPEPEPEPVAARGSKTKEFSVEFPKLHFAGYYEMDIPLYGPTDNYTSQLASYHCIVTWDHRY
jgi:hypothetical protein